MKVVFNCCTQPAKFSHNAGATLFKGEKPEVVVKSQVKPLEQPTVDTVSLSTKPESKSEVKPEIKPEVVESK